MSSAGAGTIYPLKDNQLAAANPADNVWLSASAGTGKTQVLSARVLRLLLLPHVDPSQILCLTFTKAGAAEMANRINAVLARWVRLEPGKLGKELRALGADFDPETQARARTLFASVLDCPGGGLRIDTIHAFSQWLLTNFPSEADLPPGARPMEDREKELLAREVLAELLSNAEADGDKAILDATATITIRKDPSALHSWLMRCADRMDMWEGPGAWQQPMAARVRQLLEIPTDADDAWVNEVLHPDTFPDDQLAYLLPHMRDWGTKRGDGCAEFIPVWLGLTLEQRAAQYHTFYDTVLVKTGNPRKMDKPAKAEPRIPEWQQTVADALALMAERRALLTLAETLTPALELGRAFAIRWQEAKRREGLLDFTDLIRKAASLLKSSIPSDWIRYKLDRQFDHILVDEAQDTNQAQWDIVEALIDDFFSGEGAAGDRLRTVFTVGDYKQAIFGFQGTSPENYAKAHDKILKQITEARDNAAGLRANRRLPEWADLDLGQSFRTSAPVLEFVNAVIDALGYKTFGLPKEPAPHEGFDRAGIVTLWQPVTMTSDLEESDTTDSEVRDWLPAHETVLAGKIADQVHAWLYGDDAFVLEKGEVRRASAGDVMVLVRKRGALAAQIVGQLHSRGVPVAGVDRMRLGDPLAVNDVMAALRFAAQPLDDLALANLLGSPLVGWSQEDLLEHIPRAHKMRLWDHLRGSNDRFVQETCDRLRPLLARADFETPQALIAWLLTGPWEGRAKLIARLGREANDPLDELVNAAFAYESAQVPSLAGFIQWFDASTEDLKRDADEASGQVRVMTVHGSKGLQSPIVILADATGKPGEGGALELEDAPMGDASRRHVPLPGLSKEERAGRVTEAHEVAKELALQEHWRLLYVAMTRAEEALFIGGSLGSRDAKKGPHEDSWYARLEPLFDGDTLADPIWSGSRELGNRSVKVPEQVSDGGATEAVPLPTWATTPIGPEPRPPRPLAPSGAGEEQGADPPLAAEAAMQAARRGVLIHKLLERLPDIDPGEREAMGTTWLAKHGSELSLEMRKDMLSSALNVLRDPAFAGIFSPDALAEVPLAATVGGVVVSGTADRLLVSDDQVTVIDFKTTRRPPASAGDIPVATLRQMAAYTAALEAIYPGSTVRAGVLYTHAPQMFEIPSEALRPHKQRLGDKQESFAPLDIE
ncbi:MAG: double-strand break repair helicase AddA [Erythrobacter sp.]